MTSTTTTRALGVLAYTLFTLVLGWSVLFLADLPGLRAADRGPDGPAPTAVVVDLVLLGLFAAHHSVLARPAVKRRLAGLLPPTVERSAYVLVASLLLGLVLWGWRPVPGVVWDLTWTPARVAVWCVFAAGWVITSSATWMIDHWELFGLRQSGVVAGSAPAGLRERWLYVWVRHPIMLGLLLAFVATPTMTWGHLLFAAVTSERAAPGQAPLDLVRQGA